MTTGVRRRRKIKENPLQDRDRARLELGKMTLGRI